MVVCVMNKGTGGSVASALDPGRRLLTRLLDSASAASQLSVAQPCFLPLLLPPRFPSYFLH